MVDAYSAVHRRFIMGDDDGSVELVNTTGNLTLDLSHTSRELRHFQGVNAYRVVTSRDAALDVDVLAWTAETTLLRDHLQEAGTGDDPKLFVVNFNSVYPGSANEHTAGYCVRGVADGLTITAPTDELVTMRGEIVQSDGSVLAGPVIETRSSIGGSAWNTATPVTLSECTGTGAANLWPWFDLSKQMYYVTYLTRMWVPASGSTNTNRTVEIVTRYRKGGSQKSNRVIVFSRDLPDANDPHSQQPNVSVGLSVKPAFAAGDLDGTTLTDVNFNHRWRANENRWNFITVIVWIMQEVSLTSA